MAEVAQQLKVKLSNLVQRVTSFKFGSSKDEKENLGEGDAKVGSTIVQSRAAEIDGSARTPPVSGGPPPKHN